MLLFVVAAATCWLCALLAIPRKPLPDHELQELIYCHLIGRQRRLVGWAILATAAAALALLREVG